MSFQCRDSGSMVVGWLVKVAAALLIFGVAAFDGISVGAAHVSGTDDADSAALAAADAWHTSHNVQTAFAAAQQAATDKGETVLSKGFVIDANGWVHLQMQRTASTLVMYRIGPLKKYTIVTVKGESGPSA